MTELERHSLLRGKTSMATYFAIFLVVIHLIFSIFPSDEQRDILLEYGFIVLVPLSEKIGFNEYLLHLGITSITHAFLHASWTHVLFNAIGVAFLGAFSAARMGGVRFILFMSACSIGGALAQLLLLPEHSLSVGASGAVFGLAAAYSWYIALTENTVKKRRLRLARLSFGWMFANFLVAGVFALSGYLEPSFPVIAWRAHLGGFVTGLILTPLLIRPRRQR